MLLCSLQFIVDLCFRSAAFDAEKCEAMLAQGKRNLLCGEIPQSVNQLQEVCRLLYVCCLLRIALYYVYLCHYHHLPSP